MNSFYAIIAMKGIYMEKQRKKYYKRSDKFITKIYKPTDLAYMAGIIDGEGCLHIGQTRRDYNGKITKHHSGCLKIDNTDSILIEWIMNTFNGVNSACNRWTSKRKYERTIYTWVATGDRLLDLCEQILPYLTIKKKHCENMIKFRKTFTNKIGQHTIPNAEAIKIREECLKISRKLNSRWHSHPLKN